MTDISTAPRASRADAASRRLRACLTALCMLWALLLPWTAATADDGFLPPEEAFRFSAAMVDTHTLQVSYQIADGYYMYRERFAFAAQGATLGAPQFPAGKIKFDENFQKNVETYRHAVTIRIPVDAAGPFTLSATGQGCSDKGLCYPPLTSQARLAQVAASGGGAAAASTTSADAPSAPADEAGRIEASLKSGRLLAIVPLFVLLGLGLALTPCVLPMLPILSSIIVGEGASVRRSRGLALSAVYALGMAIVYTALGIAAGLIGEGLSAALQKPWVLAAFGLLMVALSLSMFGVYELQAPAALQTALSRASGRQRAGRLAGVFAMGAISALIVGPCVAAPLAGALVYISQTRNVVVGGSALFALAVGMSVPLLLVGASAGALLPRAGAWMDAVKRFFGVLMLGVALWMVAPVLPAWLSMVGWAALGLGYGAWLLSHRPAGWLARAFGIAFVAVGLLQVVGLATGGRDPLAPLAQLRGEAPRGPAFRTVRSVAELDAALAQADRPAMLDFYADWCVSCKEMERLTFT
ncbi:MAG: protein-disulfide reductase DsbD, partial [Burkholderiaceae bacterium]